VSQERAEEALRRAAMKMPIKCKIVSRPVVGVTATEEETEGGQEDAA